MSFSSSRRYIGCAVETVTCIALYKASHTVFLDDSIDNQLTSTTSWFPPNNNQRQRDPMALAKLLLHTFVPPSIYWALGPVITRAIGGGTHVQISFSSIAANLMKKPPALMAGGLFLGINLSFSLYKGFSDSISPGNFVLHDNAMDVENVTYRIILNPLRDSLLFHSLLFTRVLALQGPMTAFICSAVAYSVAHTTTETYSRAALAGYTGLTASLCNFIDSLFLQSTFYFTGGRTLYAFVSSVCSSTQALQSELFMSRDFAFFESMSIWRQYLQGFNAQQLSASGGHNAAISALSPSEKEQLTSLSTKLIQAFSTSASDSLDVLDLGDIIYMCRCVLAKSISPATKQGASTLPMYVSLEFSPTATYSDEQTVLDLRAAFANDDLYARAASITASAPLVEFNASELSAVLASELHREQTTVGAFMSQWTRGQMDGALALLVEQGDGWGGQLEGDGERDGGMTEGAALAMVEGYYKAIWQVFYFKQERLKASAKGVPADGISSATLSEEILSDGFVLDYVEEGPSGLPPGYVGAIQHQPLVTVNADRKKLLAAAACRRAAIRYLNPQGFTIRSFRRVVRRLEKAYPSVAKLEKEWKYRINYQNNSPQ
jgi:hypothetical protein